MGNAEIEAANEIYETAQKYANIEIVKMKEEMEGVRDESKAVGILQKIAYDDAHNEMLKYAVLYQIKKSKSYKKGGMIWEDFCPALTGKTASNIDKTLRDLKPFHDSFRNKFSDLIGFSFSKIRYLGRSIQDKESDFKNGCLIFDGEEIPLTPENREEIEAAVDAMKEAHKKETEDSKTASKAKDRVLEAKQKVIRDQEKELSKFTKEISKRDYKPGEENFIKQMENRQTTITGLFLELDIERLPEDATPLMVSKYIEVLNYFKRTAHTYLDMALEKHAQPDDITWKQPGVVDVDTPTAGEVAQQAMRLVGKS